jgi:hypothetical protein
MPWPTARSIGLILLLSPLATNASPPSPRKAANNVEQVTLSGTVVSLKSELKSKGIAFDAEPIAGQVVLKGDDGSITPLISDDASRALFQDERLQRRHAEIHGRRHSGVPYLQVLSFKIEDEGRLRTPEYYCEICTISVRFPQICPCCQGPMVLRMMPEAR